MENKTRKMLTSILILVLLFAGLIVAVVLVRQRQIIEKKAAGGTATMTLTTSASTVTANNTFDVDVVVNSNGTALNGVDVILNFDPNYLQVTNIQMLNNNPTPNPTLSPSGDITHFRIYVPVTTSGTFDIDKIMSCANAGVYNMVTCSSYKGTLEFGAVSFIWRDADPPIPTPSPTTIPAASFNSGIARITFKTVQAGSATIVTKLANVPISPTPVATDDINIVDNTANDVWNQTQSSVTIVIAPAAVSPTPTPTGTASQKRDVNSDGYVTMADVSAVILATQPPFPCQLPGSPDIGLQNCY